MDVALPVDYHHFTCLLFTVPIVFFARVSLLRMFGAAYSLKYNRKTAQKLAESSFYLIQYSLLFLVSRSIIVHK